MKYNAIYLIFKFTPVLLHLGMYSFPPFLLFTANLSRENTDDQKYLCFGLPDGLVIKTVFPLQVAWVQSLVGELPLATCEIIKKKKSVP